MSVPTLCTQWVWAQAFHATAPHFKHLTADWRQLRFRKLKKNFSFPGKTLKKIYISIFNPISWNGARLFWQHTVIKWHFLWCSLLFQQHRQDMTFGEYAIKDLKLHFIIFSTLLRCQEQNMLALTCLEVHLFAVSSSGSSLRWNCVDTRHRKEVSTWHAGGRGCSQSFQLKSDRKEGRCVRDGDIFILKFWLDIQSRPQMESFWPPSAQPDQKHTEWISIEVCEQS